MINKIITSLFLLFITASCNFEGVKKAPIALSDDYFNTNSNDSIKDNLPKGDTKTIEIKSDTLQNGSLNDLVWNGEKGLRVEWVKKNSNQRKILAKDVVLVNYKARVAGGDVYDSNTKIGFPVPIKSGIGMLVEGWEIGLEQMHVGDSGRIMIPTNLAYGEVGILNVVPQNASIIVDIAIIKVIEPIELLDGVKLYKYETDDSGVFPTKNQKITFNYFAYTSGQNGELYDNSYQKGHPFSFQFENDNVVDGLHIGFSKLKANERAFIEIPSKVAYGKKGLVELVPPNTDIVFDVRVESIK